jgi:hypothetical protein
MICITTEKKGALTVVTLDGHAEDSDVQDLNTVLSSIHGQMGLNMSGLDTCSEHVIKALRDWVHSGASVLTATPFLRLMLETAAKHAATSK